MKTFIYFNSTHDGWETIAAYTKAATKEEAVDKFMKWKNSTHPYYSIFPIKDTLSISNDVECLEDQTLI